MSNENQSKCPKCMGLGWVPSAVKILCSACLGSGEVRGKTCPSCGGSGETEREIEILCEQCQGVGSISSHSSGLTPHA